MSIALWLQVEREGHPVHGSAGNHGGTVSVCPSLQEITQSRVQFTEGGADPGNNKMIEQFPIKCFVLRCIEQALPWNPGVIEQSENLP